MVPAFRSFRGPFLAVSTPIAATNDYFPALFNLYKLISTSFQILQTNLQNLFYSAKLQRGFVKFKSTYVHQI